MSAFSALILSFSAVVLVACGGGSSGSSGSNSAPVASDVVVTDVNGGETWVGDSLIGSYTYRDSDSDLEGATALQWLRDGGVITNAGQSEYIVAEGDVGHQISLQVTPLAATGTQTGVPVTSDDVPVDAFVGTRLPAQFVNSAYTGGTYAISAYLPDGYAASDLDYPVIYAVGTLRRFPEIADLLDAAARQVILIQVTVPFQRRTTDLTMPEAPKLYDFFTLELIPFIEAQYRVDPSRRTLAGHSLGGLFVGLAMLFERPGARLFASYLSSDGSFWSEWEQTVVLEQQLADVSSELPVTLILTAAAGDLSNRLVVIDFRDLLTQRNYADFNMIYMPFELSHTEVYIASLQQGVDLLLE